MPATPRASVPDPAAAGVPPVGIPLAGSACCLTSWLPTPGIVDMACGSVVRVGSWIACEMKGVVGAHSAWETKPWAGRVTAAKSTDAIATGEPIAVPTVASGDGSRAMPTATPADEVRSIPTATPADETRSMLADDVRSIPTATPADETRSMSSVRSSGDAWSMDAVSLAGPGISSASRVASPASVLDVGDGSGPPTALRPTSL